MIRRLEIIGEAVKNLPADFKKKKSSIPWQNIAGMRDFLIHEYFGVDLDLVWQTVKKDLPEFKKQILKLLDKSRWQDIWAKIKTAPLFVMLNLFQHLDSESSSKWQ